MNIKGRDLDEEHVNGQTTAAGLWMTAAIDFCAGLGREATAVLSTVLALIILGVMPWVVEKFERHDE
ncbi:putative Mg(2+) transport ATPase [compost metagenome]